MGIEINKRFSKKINENKQSVLDYSVEPIIKENRIKYTEEEENDRDLEKHVILFQNLLRGRAYQTMVKNI